MPRRASSSTNPTLIIGVAVIVIAVVFGGKFLMSKKTESFAGVNALDVGELLDNGNSLRNNEYRIQS